MTDWAQLTYTPGRWVAVAAAEQWLLVDLAAEDPVVRRCWKLMSESAGVDAVLDALLAGGVAMAPGFAFVSLRAGEERAVSRFPAVAVLHTAGADAREIAGAEGISWTDVLLGAVALEGVTLRGLLSTDSSVELPMGAGVITAGIVHIAAGTPVASVPAPARPAPRPADIVPRPLAPSAVPPSVAAPSEVAPVVVAPVVVAPLVDGPPPPSASVPPQPAPEPGPAEDHPSYDFLFGATVRPDDVARVDLRAPDVSPEQESLEDAETVQLPREQAVFPLAETLIPPPGSIEDVPAPTAESSGLIDAVPWLNQDVAPPAPARPAAVPPQPRTAPAPQLPPAPPPAPGLGSSAVSTGQVPLVDVSSTVNRAELRAVAAAGSTGPTVLAGYCPSHHLSPPHAASCRVCSAPMPQQAPFEIARPALGVLRLASGEVITLDRGVVLGRSPEVPDGDSAERPHIVRLASPENDISRTHAEVLLDGWNVYLRDFGSMNGTVITLPGQPPERLRENNPHLLENGAVITLADEVSLTFEVTP